MATFLCWGPNRSSFALSTMLVGLSPDSVLDLSESDLKHEGAFQHGVREVCEEGAFFFSCSSSMLFQCLLAAPTLYARMCAYMEMGQ